MKTSSVVSSWAWAYAYIGFIIVAFEYALVGLQAAVVFWGWLSVVSLIVIVFATQMAVQYYKDEDETVSKYFDEAAKTIKEIKVWQLNVSFTIAFIIGAVFIWYGHGILGALYIFLELARKLGYESAKKEIVEIDFERAKTFESVPLVEDRE